MTYCRSSLAPMSKSLLVCNRLCALSVTYRSVSLASDGLNYLHQQRLCLGWSARLSTELFIKLLMHCTKVFEGFWRISIVIKSDRLFFGVILDFDAEIFQTFQRQPACTRWNQSLWESRYHGALSLYNAVGKASVRNPSASYLLVSACVVMQPAGGDLHCLSAFYTVNHKNVTFYFWL